MGNEAETAGRKTSAFGSLTSRAMASAAGAIAGIGIGAVLGGAVRAASDLNETVNKTNVIFGANADEVRKWAQGSAQSFGLSRQAALEAASGFGNMLTQLGYTGDAAVEASTGTVKLAADLGSFNNLDTGDVLERISAAMRGEYDSLQLLIPNINAARVEQEALAATGKSSADALTAAEKATATLAIIQRDGAAAANDFAETSDGLANSQKILNAEWQDAQAQLGELLVGPMTGVVRLVTSGLIPAFEGAIDVVGGAVDLFTSLPGPVQAGVVALSAVVLLKGPLSSLFDTIALKALYAKDALLATSFSAGGLKAASSGLLAFFGGPIGLAITGVTVGLGFLASALSDTDDATQGTVAAQNELTDALKASKGAIDANVRASAAKELQDQGVLETLEDMGIATSLATDAVLGNEEALGTLGARLQAAINAGTDFHGVVTEEAQAAQAARNALYELAGQTDGSIASAQQLAAATAETGAVMDTTTGQTQTSTAALEDWREQIQGIAEDFVDPLETYKGLLAEKSEAEREQAQAAAEATSDASDSWEDHVRDVEVSLDELATALQTQLDNQANWRTNLVQIAQWAGADVAQYLADMGEEGVDLVAQMADGTSAEAQRMREQILRHIQMGGDEWSTSLADEMAVMERIGRDGASATVQQVARELGIGVGQVREIARKYGIELASGVNPLLRGLGKPGINISDYGYNSGGGRADGGFIDGFSPHPRADNILVPMTAGEHVQPVKRVQQYGGDLFEAFRAGAIDVGAARSLLHPGRADGGFISTAAVPKPPSTAPFRPPISTPADAAMERAYGDTVDWLEANLIPPASALSGPGRWSEMFAAVQKAFPYVQLHSGFRPGSITATGNLSYHALGRAIDITPDASIFNWIAQNYPGSRELIFSPMGGRQIWNGAPHLYGEPTRGDHWDHIHWAMANGGVIREPVIGTGLRTGQSYSFGERGPETVVPWDMSGRAGGGGWSGQMRLDIASMRFSGDLVLDSGEFLGKVQGVAEGVTTEALAVATSRGRYNR